MAKVQLLIVQSIEGYMITDYSERFPLLYKETIEVMNRATFQMNENASLYTLIEAKDRKDSDAVYFIEATPITESIINGMLRMYLIDEIITYTIPAMLGNGKRAYQPDLPKTDWKCTLTKTLKDGAIKTIFQKIQ